MSRRPLVVGYCSSLMWRSLPLHSLLPSNVSILFAYSSQFPILSIFEHALNLISCRGNLSLFSSEQKKCHLSSIIKLLRYFSFVPPCPTFPPALTTAPFVRFLPFPFLYALCFLSKDQNPHKKLSKTREMRRNRTLVNMPIVIISTYIVENTAESIQRNKISWICMNMNI